MKNFKKKFDAVHLQQKARAKLSKAYMEPRGQARGPLETHLRPSGFFACGGIRPDESRQFFGGGEVRPTQKHQRRHLAEAEDAFIPGQGRGLLRRRIKNRKRFLAALKEKKN